MVSAPQKPCIRSASHGAGASRPAATAEAEFPAGEVNNVEEVRDHAGDLADGFILHGLLAGLDEVQVVLQQGSIQNRGDAVGAGKVGGFLHVGVGDGLAANEVRSCLDSHKGNVVLALALYASLNLVKVNVALEGKGAFKFASDRVEDGHIAAHPFDLVSARGGKGYIFNITHLYQLDPLLSVL